MEAQKDIISKLHERIGNPLLASLFMYLIFLSDENGVVKKSYSEIGQAFKMSKQLVAYNIGLLRSFDGVLTDGFPITICNVGFYKGFTHTSFTASLRKLDAKPKKKKDEASVELFDKWWNAYDKKRSKKKALEKWLKLKVEQQTKCLSVVDAYVRSTPDKQYRMDPTTYINGEHWEDEIITRKESGIDTGIILRDTKNKNYEIGWK